MMLAYMSEKKIHQFLLDEYYKRRGTTNQDKGAYVSETVDADTTLGIMSDLRGDSGLLFTKISLNELISFTPDLTPFLGLTPQFPELDETVEEALLEYDTPLYFTSTLTKPMYDTEHTDRQLMLFKKTRALLGLGNLCFTEAFLVEEDDYFIIEAAPGCTYYTGTIKVKIK